jgi:hypothetical protein
MTTSAKLQSLLLYIVWHARFQPGEELARGLYAKLARDLRQPMHRGIGLPIRFLRGSRVDGVPEIPLDRARHTAVVVLVDDEMVADPAWEPRLADLWRRTRDPDSPHRLFPVALTEHAVKMDALGEVNVLSLFRHPSEEWPELLLHRLVHELCRQLRARPRVGQDDGSGTAPVRAFLSHAKRDGLPLAEELRDYIHQHTQLKSFFDAQDIPYGAAWKKVLEAAAGSCALLVVQTDAYASREWCRNEVLAAKRQGMPVLVVNALEEGEARSFPYLGNTPTIRWRPDRPRPHEAVLGRLLYQVLRTTYFPLRVEDLRARLGLSGSLRPLPHAPELLTLMGLALEEPRDGPIVLVYPDPPLGNEEIGLLREHLRELGLEHRVSLTTPSGLPAQLGSPPGAVAGGSP